MAAHQVRALLMGGQACVFYGAAEFSRDTDLLILADKENLQRLTLALNELQAECIAVPPFAAEYLERGHAVHFRCHHPDAVGMRVDVMSRLRGVDPFEMLWGRRTSITDEDGTLYELLALPDLVKAKKTQCSKDWPMLRRLVDAHYLQHSSTPTPERQCFWLLEMRTPDFLAEIASSVNHSLVAELKKQRRLIEFAQTNQIQRLEVALEQEERLAREADRIYWQPLKTELERLRHAVRKS